MTKGLIALLGAVTLATPAGSQVLWQNVSSGMTIAQIKAAQPSAVASDKPERLASGAQCELRISDYDISAKTYRVCFYMLGGKLSQITMSANEPSQVAFRTITDLLRAKYGTELSPKPNPCTSGFMATCEVTWLLPTGVNVEVLFLQVGRTDPLLNVVYQTRMKSESNKL